MTIKELDQRLTLVLEDFSSEMRSEYDDYSNEPVTGGDIAQLSRQTFYALDIFDGLDVLENFLGRFFGFRNSGDDNSSGHVVLLS